MHQDFQTHQSEMTMENGIRLLNVVERTDQKVDHFMNALLEASKYEMRCRWEKRDLGQQQDTTPDRGRNSHNQESPEEKLKTRLQIMRSERARRDSSMEQIAHHLGVSPATAKEDSRYTLQEGEGFSVKLQIQASAFIGSSAVQDWLASGETSCLFAQADSNESDHVSALSFVTSLLYQTLQTSSKVISLLYACGLHTDCYRDPFPNAEGMVRSLIAQLLHAPQYSGLWLVFNDNTLQDLEGGGISGLCKIFEHLLSQLPQSAILVLLVDSISSYETEDRVKGTCRAMSSLIHIVEGAKCTVKLLVTSSGMSSYVRKGFREEDILWVPDADVEGVNDFGYAMNKLQQRMRAVGSGDIV
ncbi:MAG: hypothetical protein Q9213_006614 [Squamulea squamosa]